MRSVTLKIHFCYDHYITCVTVLKTLEMSATSVYMVRSTHFHKDKPMKPPKWAYTHCATTNIRKDDIYYMKRKGRVTLVICERY